MTLKGFLYLVTVVAAAFEQLNFIDWFHEKAMIVDKLGVDRHVAEIWCDSVHGHLLKIKDADHFGKLVNVGLNHSIHLGSRTENRLSSPTGSTDPHRTFAYKWFDGSSFEHLSWASGEPSCRHECCTVIFNSTAQHLYDTRCETRLGIVCIIPTESWNDLHDISVNIINMNLTSPELTTKTTAIFLRQIVKALDTEENFGRIVAFLRHIDTLLLNSAEKIHELAGKFTSIGELSNTSATNSSTHANSSITISSLLKRVRLEMDSKDEIEQSIDSLQDYEIIQIVFLIIVVILMKGKKIVELSRSFLGHRLFCNRRVDQSPEPAVLFLNSIPPESDRHSNNLELSEVVRPDGVSVVSVENLDNYVDGQCDSMKK